MMSLQPARRVPLRLPALVLGLTLVLAAIAGNAMAAGKDSQDARDIAAVSAVKLDMDLARRVAAVSNEARQALDASCLLQGEDQSLDACIATISREPAIAAALARHDLSARQYTLALSALMSGDLGAQAVASDGKAAWDELAALGVNPEHVRFMQAHRDELNGLFDGQ